jgi:hypothetical protein
MTGQNENMEKLKLKNLYKNRIFSKQIKNYNKKK